MKRKRIIDNSSKASNTIVFKRNKKGSEGQITSVDVLQSSVCKFVLREKVIGFYGGWPYIGNVQAIEAIEMSFGTAFVLLVRWNGFSGKNAMTWTSEFDIVPHDEEHLKLKEEVCTRPFVDVFAY